MRVRRWIYLAAVAGLVVVGFLTAYDQVAVDFGDDSSYLLGKATPTVAWVLTLVTPFALFDFFTWLRRSHKSAREMWWATTGVLAGFSWVGFWQEDGNSSGWWKAISKSALIVTSSWRSSWDCGVPA